MDDDDARAYLSHHLREVRVIRDDADRIVAELEAVLTKPTPGPMAQLAFGEWVEERRRQLEHVETELFVLAYAPPPPVWLVFVLAPPPPWWRILWPW